MSEKKKGKMLSTICDNTELPGQVRELILSHRFVNVKVFLLLQQFSTVMTILEDFDHFGPFQIIRTILDRSGPFWTVWTVL